MVPVLAAASTIFRCRYFNIFIPSRTNLNRLAYYSVLITLPSVVTLDFSVCNLCMCFCVWLFALRIRGGLVGDSMVAGFLVLWNTPPDVCVQYISAIATSKLIWYPKTVVFLLTFVFNRPTWPTEGFELVGLWFYKLSVGRFTRLGPGLADQVDRVLEIS